MRWTTKPLAEVAEFCLGKMLDDKKNKGEPLPYLANINVRWGECDLGNLREMRFAHDEMDRYGLKYGDIVMCEGGEPGRCAIWKESVPGMMIQKALHRIRPHDCLDHRFLFYSFLHKGRTGGFSPLFTGATIKHLPREKLAMVEIAFPRLDAQRRIADLLSAYDDLIENNRRRMALLEEAVRQLYREWFVRLRFPGHEHTRVSDGVPERWQRRPLVSCVIFRSGGTPSKNRAEYWDGDIPWVSSGEMSETRLYDTPLHVSPEGADAGSRLVTRDTVLVVVRGMSLAKEFRLAMVAREMAFNQDLKALECRDGIDSLFLFHSLLDRRDGIRDLATEASHGTKKLDTAVLERLPIVVAEPRLQRLFRDTVASSLAQRDNLYHQNARLRAARDLLLPRLMSGEIAV
ncbi:MAG: restriction endonuclease subunit S [Vicinamibacterales bacterium]